MNIKDQIEQYRSVLSNLKSGEFRHFKIDEQGKWIDQTQEFIDQISKILDD